MPADPIPADLAAVPAPRAARGGRHPLACILGLAAAAVLAGARSIAAIAEWAADAPQPVRAALGARSDDPGHCSVPAEATIRRTLSHLDADVLAGAIGAWLADRDSHQDRDRGGPATRRRAVAVDGTTLRGARTPGGDGRPVHLLAAMDHASPAVLAQRQIGGAPEEVSAFAPLVAPLDLAGVVVTADALQTSPTPPSSWSPASRPTTCWWSRPTSPPCWTAARPCPGTACPWATAPATKRTAGSSCAPSRWVSVQGFGFPHAAQVLQVTRKTRDLHTNRWQAVTVYAITSLPFHLARPARLADLVHGHWAIEALHHVRDTTFAEDDSQVRTGAAPGVMAVLRNLVIGTLCRAGPVNVAAALRRHARDPRRPLATLGISLE